MKRKAAFCGALLGGGALFALAFALPLPHVVGASDAPSAALTVTTGTAPSDELARDVPTSEPLLAFGSRRCKPTLRHPCRRGHRDQPQG